jgi:hypothetical protein
MGKKIRDIPSLVVKVQLALHTSDGAAGARCLITNEERTILYETEAEDVVRAMAGRAKAYFRATLKDTFLTLGEEVPEPDW